MAERQHTTVALEETVVQDLASRLRGELLGPGDAGYEQARRVYKRALRRWSLVGIMSVAPNQR
jgi:hypothetical protein